MFHIKKKEWPRVPENKAATDKKDTNDYKQMKLDDIMKHITQKCGNTMLDRYGARNESENNDVVIFLPIATKELETMVYWGDTHPINRYEQIFEGIGHIFMDGNRRIDVISHLLYIYAAERTPVSACISNGTYNSVISRIEYEIGIYNKNELSCNVRKDGTVYDPFINADDLSRPVLYGHTHPGLGCFFSPPDRVSGFASPSLPAVTFVTDPIRRDMKAGVGIELRDAQILVYSYEEKI